MTPRQAKPDAPPSGPTAEKRASTPEERLRDKLAGAGGGGSDPPAPLGRRATARPGEAPADRTPAKPAPPRVAPAVPAVPLSVGERRARKATAGARVGGGTGPPPAAERAAAASAASADFRAGAAWEAGDEDFIALERARRKGTILGAGKGDRGVPPSSGGEGGRLRGDDEDARDATTIELTIDEEASAILNRGIHERPARRRERDREREREIMVTATLVADDGGGGVEGGYGNEPAEPELVAVAEKVSSRHCYICGRSVHWLYVAGAVAALVTTAVAVATTLAMRGGGPLPPAVDPEELGICGNGKRRNGTCYHEGDCCSPFGFCGTSPDHCVSDSALNRTGYSNLTGTVGPVSSDKICGGYYPDWIDDPRVRDIHPNYNLVYLFAARQYEATDGSVSFTPPYDIEEFREDVQHERSTNNRTFVLSVGGFGHAFAIPNRTFSETLVESLSDIYDEIGGFDGLDWLIYSDGIEPSTEEMIWVGLELRRRYPGFLLSSSPEVYLDLDMDFCSEAVSAGALDYCAPKFYGAQDLNVKSSILRYVKKWVDLLGEEHIAVGLRVNDGEGYWQTTSQAMETYNETKAAFPGIRGVFNWQISYDHKMNTGFAQLVCTV